MICVKKESFDEKKEVIINPISIFYDESDLLSLTKLKIISMKIKFEKEKMSKNEDDKQQYLYNFDSLVNLMNNSTTIDDFNSILERLITNNPYVNNKFTELL
jgi:hypothetical protein